MERRMRHVLGVLGFVAALAAALVGALLAGAVGGVGIVALHDGRLPSRGDVIAGLGSLLIALALVLVVFLTSREGEDETGVLSVRLVTKCALAGLAAVAVPVVLFRGRIWSPEVALVAVQGAIAGASFAVLARLGSR